MRARVLFVALLLSLTASPLAARAAAPMTLVVDAREVSRNILHVRLDVPISGGPVRMEFPKWVPGQHAPANPVVDLVVLRGNAGAANVTWQRDQVDLFGFTFDAPKNARVLTLHYDALLSPGYTTPRLALINWNPTLLYPNGVKTSEQQVSASLILPAGWHSSTALDGPRVTGNRIDFAPVSVERLFDSPVLAGANLSVIPLNANAELDVASDSDAAAVINDKVKEHFVSLVEQAQMLFGAHHWRTPYHFLITATDAIGYTGLEHHESSWNGVETETLATEAATKRYAGDLLTHEFTHSWNGKYRRPAGLFRPDYQANETTDLLWVYEGLTEYYSDILAARAGFWSPEEYRATIGQKYAALDAEAGRSTRSLEDTTFQSRLSGGRGGAGAFNGTRRSSEEYYDEGELMWLDADTLIRERSHGAKSLDDFAKAFYGGTDGPPQVIPYTRADIVAALNAVQPNDWEAFFHARLDVPTLHPPIDGITRSGYTVAFGAKPPVPYPSLRARPGDWRFSLGATIAPTGAITDIVAGSPAAKAGLAPGMTIIAVNSHRYSLPLLTTAVERAVKSKAPMVLLVDNRQTFQTKTVRYDGGIRLPFLERTTGAAGDAIGDIVKART
jgi:predicted metalloprotease with PDZ domain